MRPIIFTNEKLREPRRKGIYCGWSPRARKNVNRTGRILLILRINGFHSLTPECTFARPNPDFKLDDARGLRETMQKKKGRKRREDRGPREAEKDDRFREVEEVSACHVRERNFANYDRRGKTERSATKKSAKEIIIAFLQLSAIYRSPSICVTYEAVSASFRVKNVKP